jgi:hypothetical protein
MIPAGILHETQRPLWASRWFWSLWDMIEFKIGRFVACAGRITAWHQMALTVQQQGQAMRLDARGFDDLKSAVSDMLEIGRDCDLDVVAHWAKEAKEELERFSLKPNDTHVEFQAGPLIRLSGSIGRLQDAIIGQSQSRFMLLLDARAKERWEPSRPTFGDDFKNRFQTLQYDLGEAGKCLALGRGTATIFHLMRIMEGGLRAIRSCLGAPSLADRNWGAILKQIKDAITARGSGWSEREPFQEMYASLDAVKDAWRNPTMHIENKYTEEEAEHVFAMVRGFMQKIAAKFDENGDPRV